MFLARMSDERPEDLPKTQPAFARIPPWPPKKTARGLVDDEKPLSIAVMFTEHRQRPGKTESSERIADVTFDPRRSRLIHETLTLRDLPPLFVTASYTADTGAVTVMVLQSERELLSISSPGPTDAFSTFRLSSEVVISIIILRKCKT
jgi:hypothetical protein